MCKPSQNNSISVYPLGKGNVKPDSLQLANSLWALPLQHVQSKTMPIISAIGPATAGFLLSAQGRAAADELHDTALDDAHLPTLLNSLRRRFEADQAGALVALARLRHRAAAKFPHAERLFFTAEALEQATAWEVAQQHASWIDRHAPPGVVLDLGCGIGGDLLALARHRHVVAYELDPVRAAFAQANATAMGLAERIEVRTRDWVADLHASMLPVAAAAFADPARRVGERRVFRLDQMQPPIGPLLQLQATVAVLGVKVMPSIADADLPAGCGVEFISHQGVCKEAVLWFGPARWRPKWASLVTGDSVKHVAGDEKAPPLGGLAPGQVLYEPDPALIRAGCLAWLCRRLEAHLFDPEIAYLAGDTWRPDPVAQAFTVDEVHPFALKLLNRRLQELGVARVELKKRGFPVEPESLRPRLKLADQGRDAVVIFTRILDRTSEPHSDEHYMIIGRRLRGAT
jgi:SAM-dependent methyltransferase